jgi:hypothetical protein
MLSTPELLQTEPDGNPADDVGMFLIDRLLTIVEQFLSAVIPSPITNVQAKLLIVLPEPPIIPLKELEPLIVFLEPVINECVEPVVSIQLDEPSNTVEYCEQTQFDDPLRIVVKTPEDILNKPLVKE